MLLKVSITFQIIQKLKLRSRLILYQAKLQYNSFKLTNISKNSKIQLARKWNDLIYKVYHRFVKRLEISIKFSENKSNPWITNYGNHQQKIFLKTSEFRVQNCKIIPKECKLNALGQDCKQLMNQFSSTMAQIDNQFKLMIEIIEQKQIKINFESMTMTEYSICTGNTFFVNAVDICSHRNLLASASDDNTVNLWSLENNKLIKTYEYSNAVFDVVFSNLGHLLAFGGSSDCTVKLVNISDLNKDNAILELKGHKDTVMRLTFSNDSEYLISGSDDTTVIVWDVIQTKQLFQLNSVCYVYGVGISSDNSIITSNSYDGNIRLWNFQNQNLLCTQKAHDHGTGIQFSKDQKMLVSSGFDGQIKLWSLVKLNNQNKLVLIRKFKTATKQIWTVLFSTCSQFIILMSNEKKEIKVIYSETGFVVKLFSSKSTNERLTVQVAISQHMDIIAYGEDNNVVVWRQK